MLIDPKGGVPYAFGEQLPSAHMTAIAEQQPRALDIVQGGTYTNSGDVTILAAPGGPKTVLFETVLASFTRALKYGTLTEFDLKISAPSQYVAMQSDADTLYQSDWLCGVGSADSVTQMKVATGARIVFDFDTMLWHARVLGDLYVTGFKLRAHRPSASTPPTGTSLPRYRLLAHDLSTLTSRVIDDQYDPGGAGYQFSHEVALTVGEKLSDNESLRLEVYGEQPGANTAAGLQIGAIEIRVEREIIA